MPTTHADRNDRKATNGENPIREYHKRPCFLGIRLQYSHPTPFTIKPAITHPKAGINACHLSDAKLNIPKPNMTPSKYSPTAVPANAAVGISTEAVSLLNFSFISFWCLLLIDLLFMIWSITDALAQEKWTAFPCFPCGYRQTPVNTHG